jgi:hypothetical protein
VTGFGLDFALLAEARAWPGSPRTIGFYVAQGDASPGAIRLTWAPAASPPASISYLLTQYEGVRVGDGGLAAVAQVHFVGTAPNQNFVEGRLDPLEDPTNAVAAFFMAGTKGQVIVPEAGFTSTGWFASRGALFSLASTFRAGDDDLTPRASWERVASNIWLAIELRAASTSAPA